MEENYHMDVKFLNPFVEAAAEVLKVEIGTAVFRGELSLQKSSMTADDVTVLIYLIGQVYGVVMYGMSIATGLGMVSKIMDQEFQEFNSLAQSGVAELGNVITGRTAIKFSEAGYESTISPPTVITGKLVQISTLDFPRLVVPLQTKYGDVRVHLALKSTPPGTSAHPEEFMALKLPTEKAA
jgi:chemotaxis protein CheX